MKTVNSISGGKTSAYIAANYPQSTPEDKYFSKIPFAETAEQQAQKQIAGKANKNWADEIFGKWPGDETDEEFDKLLNDL